MRRPRRHLNRWVSSPISRSSCPNRGSTSPAIVGYSLQIIAGAGWSRQPNAARVRSESTIRKEASPAERHAAMTWTQRLERVFSIDIEACGRCEGPVRVIACIEDQDKIRTGHIVNTLSGMIGEGPGSTRFLSLSKQPRLYFKTLTSQIRSSTSHNLTVRCQ